MPRLRVWIILNVRIPWGTSIFTFVICIKPLDNFFWFMTYNRLGCSFLLDIIWSQEWYLPAPLPLWADVILFIVSCHAILNPLKVLSHRSNTMINLSKVDAACWHLRAIFPDQYCCNFSSEDFFLLNQYCLFCFTRAWCRVIASSVL